jgi:hypothetical protein
MIPIAGRKSAKVGRIFEVTAIAKAGKECPGRWQLITKFTYSNPILNNS